MRTQTPLTQDCPRCGSAETYSYGRWRGGVPVRMCKSCGRTFKAAAAPPPRLVSRTNQCPYCLSFETYGNGKRNGFYTYRCKECEKNFRSTFVSENSDDKRTHGIGITKAFFNVHSRIVAHFELTAYDGVELLFEKDGIIFHKNDDSYMRLLQKTVRGFANTLVFSNKDLSLVVREEFGIDCQTESMTLIIDKIDEEMALIKRSLLTGKITVTYDYQRFIAVRANGTASFSAALRDEMNLKPGAYVFLYEKDDKYCVFSSSNNENFTAEKKEGFRVYLQGARGFSNYYAVSNSAFARFLCDIYAVEPSNPFRITVAAEVEIDGIRMHKLLTSNT